MADVGSREVNGHWKPTQPPGDSPFHHWPVKPVEVFKWLFKWGGFLYPQRAFYVLLAFGTWYLLQADLKTARDLSAGWIAFMLLRNVVMLFIVNSFYHLTLYVWKLQGDTGKYHPKWQAKNSRKYMFNNQVLDNMFWTLGSGSIIWTAWEVLYIWLAANGKMPLSDWTGNPVWFAALFLIIPFWRDTHFYFVHRLIHWKPLLRAVHSVHHKNPNPGPWSGMSMHPVEHLLYFSVLLIHFVVPSHPIHFFYTAQLTALGPAQGHTGFEGPLFGGRWPAGDYFHYLHHKHVSCNFGIGFIPWDKWLGRYYDGNGPYHTKKQKSAQ